MSNLDFKGNRRNIGNMKMYMTPTVLQENGITSFAAAEMDCKTAPSVIAAVKDIAERGIYGFTIPTEDYRNAVKWWQKEVRNWSIDNDWIVPVLGTIYAVATAIRMTTEEGDGVIVQPPVYYRYEQAASRLNRKTVYNSLKVINGQYEMDFEDLEKKMRNPENKLLVICNAHNPIGRVWSEEDLRKIGELSEKYDVIVVSDEIFGEMTFGDHKAIPYGSLKEGLRNAITVTSLGKAFNFTGVNHANVIIPNADLRERYERQKYADHYGSMGPFEYAAVLGAYCPDGQLWFKEVCEYIKKNGEYVKWYLEKHIPKATVFPIEGTSACWIDWSFLGLKGEELRRFFEEEALFVVETGEVYGKGCESMTRMNLSSERIQIEAALIRVKNAIDKTWKKN